MIAKINKDIFLNNKLFTKEFFFIIKKFTFDILVKQFYLDIIINVMIILFFLLIKI